MESLERAFEERDPDLYAGLLDDGFWFTETDCLGQFLYYNDKQQELDIMGGGDSTRGIFDVFRTIEFGFWTSKRHEESGADSPMAFEGDPDGHPEEDWLVFRGRVDMLLLTEPDEGFIVDQVMTFKLRQDEDGMWRLRRWVDHPLSTDCGEPSGKAAAESPSWGWVKAWVMASASG